MNRTYPRALARARYLGFNSVSDAIKKKLAEGDPVSTVADKLDVSWNTLYAWIKTAGIRVAPNPRKRNWWLTTEKYPVGRLKR